MKTEDGAPPLTVRQHAAGLKSTYDRLRSETDGCTMSPDMNFEQCCIEHDLHYRHNSENISRAEADARLRRCIAGKNHAVVAWAYWFAVRVFGRKQWKK